METYLFENKRLILIDTELSLAIDEPFDPLRLPERPQWGQEIAPDSFVAGNVAGTEFYIEKQGHPHGQCRLYSSSKAVKGEMFYTDGRLHGPSSFFGDKGQLLAQSWYIQGQQQGKCRWFYPNGALYSLQRYKDGLQHGKQEYFRPDGTHKTILTYAMGAIKEVNLRAIGNNGSAWERQNLPTYL